MSAITGIFRRDGRKVDPKHIKKMNDQLSYRGPDGSGILIDKSVAFGHQMLHITPESLNEKLPYSDEKSGLVITADARIDNRKELSKELDLDNKVNISDSYYILKAYQRWGNKCPEYLLGDFAFVIYDKNHEKLFCARDHMGVKPFYYHLSNKGFYFATEIKPLLKIPEIPVKINELKIGDYIISNYEDRQITFYEDILRLPAAHTLQVDFENHSLHQYWSLNPNYELKLDSDEEYANAMREIFTEAVNCRLRSAFPVGSELSGGLDSSSISCMSQKILSRNNKRLKTFSVLYEGFPNSDEKEYIDIVSNSCEIEAHYLDGVNINEYKEMKKWKWPQDEPINGHSLFTYLNLYKKAQNEGVRTLLSGDDGDSTLGAHGNYLQDLFRKRKYKSLIREISEYSKIHNTTVLNTIFYQIGPLAPEPLKNIWKFFKDESEYKFTLNGIKVMNNDFSRKININERIKMIEEKYKNKSGEYRHWHYHLLTSGVIQENLETLDQMAALCSLEIRYPFYDRRVLEFGLSLPTEQKMDKGKDRIIIRRAMENILPHEILARFTKASPADVLTAKLLKCGINNLENLINNDESPVKEYINIKILEKFYKKFILNARNEEYLIYEYSILSSVYYLNYWLKLN